MAKKISVLVSGATGKQGGALARALLAHKQAVYALTRKPDSRGAREIERLGARIITGDFDDQASIVKAARGIDTFFVMSTSFEKGPEAEAKQGIAVLDAAKAAGVKHIVYTSVASADKETGIPHFESKYKIETHLRSLGIPFSIIAPVSFFENILSPMSIPNLKKNIYAGIGNKRMQMIAVENIGEFAGFVIENIQEFAGKRIDIAGDEISGNEVAEILTHTTGRRISFIEQSIEEIGRVSRDLAKMYDWINEHGYSADIKGLRERYPRIAWLHFADWAEKQDWKMLLS
jgi:uncharacterized protein YbjT (DUF2867 family)